MNTLQIVDSHCHLNDPKFQGDFEDVLTRAEQAGVSHMTTICTSLGEFEEVAAIAEAHAHIYASLGIHPHEVEKEAHVTYDDIAKHAVHPKVIGIGETGLDFYYEHSPRALQEKFFRMHCAVARDFDLPVIVHTRDADDDTIRILREESQGGKLRGLIHCFTAGQKLADAVQELGFSISISGIISFKNAVELQETVKTIPLEKLLIETDAPYLAPVPHRGKRNEPSFVYHVAAALAELKGVTIAELAKVTTENYFNLFTKLSC